MTENWVQLFIGAWLILSPWILGFSNMIFLKWSSVLSGLIIGLINAWILFKKDDKEIAEKNKI